MKTIIGKVTDQNGEGLPYANVIIPGTTTGTATDELGNFSLNVPPDTTELKASYVGFFPLTLPVDGGMINFSLKENANELQEVEVVANKIKQKKNYTTIAIVSAIALVTLFIAWMLWKNRGTTKVLK